MMKPSNIEPKIKKKILTKRLPKKKKVFKDPFLRELNEPKAKKSPSISSSTTKSKVIKDDDVIISRTASNKSHIKRLLPKTRLQLPSHTLRSARTFAHIPSVSVVSHENTDVQHRQLPVVCSRAALNFHGRRLGDGTRTDNDYRLGQRDKRRAGRMKIDHL